MHSILGSSGRFFFPLLHSDRWFFAKILERSRRYLQQQNRDKVFTSLHRSTFIQAIIRVAFAQTGIFQHLKLLAGLNPEEVREEH